MMFIVELQREGGCREDRGCRDLVDQGVFGGMGGSRREVMGVELFWGKGGTSTENGFDGGGE
jgi:hypothetical protein